MYKKIKKYIEEQQMLKKGDRLVVGISGGADSVCLTHILWRLKQDYSLSLVAVHVHHGLRGESAGADAKFSEEFCRRLQIPFRLFEEDVKAYAGTHGLTVEEAGRNVRRRIFEEVSVSLEEEAATEKAGSLEGEGGRGGVKIALAHHKNDNAETLLWNLCRGTGLRGLGGISPVEGRYIRPLLGVSRREIENYLIQEHLTYRTDETNEEDHYTRNKIRHHVIPYLEQELNEQAVDHMSELTRQMRVLEEYVRKQVEENLSTCFEIRETEGTYKQGVLFEEAFEQIEDALKPYMLQKIMQEMTGKLKDIGGKHIEILGDLIRRQVGKRVELPYRLKARRVYEGLEFEIGVSPKRLPEDAEDLWAIRTFPREAGPVLFPKSIYTKWFDYDIITSAVTIRHRTTGDYITINKEGRTQTLKQFFINQKIPADKRDEIWLVADGHHILWVVGYRQNQFYQITEETRQVLEITFRGGENNGREN